MKIKKVYVDVLTALAKGTDAGIYRLNPKRVEIVSCEQDVKRVLAECENTLEIELKIADEIIKNKEMMEVI